MDDVVFVNDSGGWGGGEKILWLIIQGIVDTHPDLNPQLIVGSEGQLADQSRDLGVAVTVVPIPEDSRDFIGLVRWGWRTTAVIRSLDADTVYLNNIRSILFCSVLVRLSGMRLIWHEHNIQTSAIRRVVINILAFALSSTIIAVSNAVADSYWSVNSESIKVVHNALNLDSESTDHENISFDVRAAYDIDQETTVVTHPSVLQPWKGQDVFLEAIGRASDELSGTKFLFLGDLNTEPGYREELQSIIDAHGLADDIVFLDYVEDVMDIYLASDVIVHSSLRPDPFPTVILEAMAARRPVIATCTGGVPEMVVNEKTGLLVPPGDVEALSTALIQLVTDEELARQFGNAGRRRLVEEFVYEEFVADVAEVIRTA